MTGPSFRPGRALNRGFYGSAVAPLLGGIPHAAGLLGWGSDVLGYDTERSTDHGWGPRLVLLVGAADVTAVRQRVDAGLPASFEGWPVRYGWDEVAVGHQVTVDTLDRWTVDQLGRGAPQDDLVDWLLVPQHRLLGVVAGEVYADATGALTMLRARLAWFPDQVWRWMLACQWQRIGQEEAFVQRTAEVGDHAGSMIICARLVRDAMRLALLQARRFAPYGKWLGTAFAGLDHADGLDQQLMSALSAGDLRERENALVRAFELLAERHNALGLTEVVDPSARRFYGRPAQVLRAERFVEALLATVDEPVLRELPLIGSVDQMIDSTDLLDSPELLAPLVALYRRS